MKTTENDYRKNIDVLLSCITEHIDTMKKFNSINSFHRLQYEFYSLNEDIVKLKHRLNRLKDFKGKGKKIDVRT